MAREVIWTEPAWQVLDAAADFIARDSESYAAVLVQELKESVTSLTQFAERGRMVPEFRNQRIREPLVGSYRLIYEISNDRILILALIHGVRRTRRIQASRGGQSSTA